MTMVDTLITMLQSGAGSLASYLAAHVLLCLLPAFFIAGAMTALIPKEAITRYLGRGASKWVSYPMAALGGFVLAVCTCTILPLFAGIYRNGAGLGPATTFLFVGPAINILAVSYTGVAIGLDIAVARIVLSAIFGVGIGLIMAHIYRRDDQAREQTVGQNAFAGSASVKPAVIVFLLLLLSALVVGTLGISLFTNTVAEFSLPITAAERWQAALDRLVPYDASQGQEGVSLQGIVLIILLALIGVSAYLGLSNIDDGFTPWSWVALGLIGLTLLLAAFRVTVQPQGVLIGITGRFVGELIVLTAVALVAWKWLDGYEVRECLWEMWRFVKQIFPLLIVGVFIAGMVRVLIPPSLIQAIAGRNSVWANLMGVLFGVFMYFPTLVEVPIANMFLGLGMHRGPLLAYLMADPELSVRSILITAKIIGNKKAWIYVGWVTLFSTLAGLIYGAWVDQAPLRLVALYVVITTAILSVGLWLVSRFDRKTAAHSVAPNDPRGERRP